MINKALLATRIVTICSALMIASAVYLGFRGTTYFEAKNNLQFTYEQDVREANYNAEFARSNDVALATLLPQVLFSHDYGYAIRYPSEWNYENRGRGLVILTGKEGSPSFFANINIQTIRTQKSGGLYADVDHFLAALKTQIETASPNVNYLASGPIALKQLNGTTLSGKYMIFTFSQHGLAFKRWQVVVMRNDGQVFYVFAYTAPLVQFQDDLAMAQAMVTSWNIFR